MYHPTKALVLLILAIVIAIVVTTSRRAFGLQTTASRATDIAERAGPEATARPIEATVRPM